MPAQKRRAKKRRPCKDPRPPPAHTPSTSGAKGEGFLPQRGKGQVLLRPPVPGGFWRTQAISPVAARVGGENAAMVFKQSQTPSSLQVPKMPMRMHTGTKGLTCLACLRSAAARLWLRGGRACEGRWGRAGERGWGAPKRLGAGGVVIKVVSEGVEVGHCLRAKCFCHTQQKQHAREDCLADPSGFTSPHPPKHPPQNSPNNQYINPIQCNPSTNYKITQCQATHRKETKIEEDHKQKLGKLPLLFFGF